MVRSLSRVGEQAEETQAGKSTASIDRSALIEAQRLNAPSSKQSVPAISRDMNPLYEPACSDNLA